MLLANTARLMVDEQFAALLFCVSAFPVTVLEIFGVEHYRIAIVDSRLNHILLDGPSLQIKFILLKIRQATWLVFFFNQIDHRLRTEVATV